MMSKRIKIKRPAEEPSNSPVYKAGFQAGVASMQELVDKEAEQTIEVLRQEVKRLHERMVQLTFELVTLQAKHQSVQNTANNLQAKLKQMTKSRTDTLLSNRRKK